MTKVRRVIRDRVAYALAKQPPMATANSIIGPKSIANDFIMLGFKMIRDGRVTPAERT